MTDTPMDAARRAADAARIEDWRAVALACDPLSLELFKRRWVEQLSNPARPPLTVEEMRRRQPDLPEAVAQYQVERIRRSHAEAHSNIGKRFAGISSVEELMRLDPAEVFARYLEANGPGGRRERLAGSGKVPVAVLERMKRAWSSAVFPEPLGAVGVDDEHAFVICARLDDDSFPWADSSASAPPALSDQDLKLLRWSGTPVRVLRACRQADGAWRLVAGEDFLAWSGLGPVRMAIVRGGPGPASSS